MPQHQNVAIAIHSHNYGNDGYMFAYEGDTIPNWRDVAKYLKIDYDYKLEHLVIAPLNTVVDGINIDALPFVKNEFKYED